MIHFVTRQMTGSGFCRCVEIAKYLGCTYGTIYNPIPKGTKLLVVVQRELPEDIPKDCIVVVDVLDHDTPLIDTADAVIVPSCHARDLIKARNSNIFVVTNHHMNNENHVVPYSEDNIGFIGYIGPVKWFKAPPSDLSCAIISANVQSKNEEDMRSLYSAVDNVDTMWNYRIDRIDVNFKTAAKSKNAMSWGIPSINAPEPVTVELTPKGCIICDYNEAGDYYKELSINRTLYKEIREEGLREARQFHISVIADQYRKMFKELLK